MLIFKWPKIQAAEVVFVAAVGREIIDVNTEVKWPAWLPGEPRINMDFDTTHRAGQAAAARYWGHKLMFRSYHFRILDPVHQALGNWRSLDWTQSLRDQELNILCRYQMKQSGRDYWVSLWSQVTGPGVFLLNPSVYIRGRPCFNVIIMGRHVTNTGKNYKSDWDNNVGAPFPHGFVCAAAEASSKSIFQKSHQILSNVGKSPSDHFLNQQIQPFTKLS